MEVIDRILILLKEKDIPESEFFRAIGVHRATFYRWKSKTTSVSVKNIRKIAAYLNVTTDYLIGK